ncbi:Hint domain-containing protein [Thioclava litoralis]|uniref:Hint domain-containing protein n=1 Tax=Thioclava litoralis TaxID=3076557 RepID=A0ABZ1E3C6_9RHOB|nr:Hint domain-containing protein [Thioclava sp. FTW29]
MTQSNNNASNGTTQGNAQGASGQQDNCNSQSSDHQDACNSQPSSPQGHDDTCNTGGQGNSGSGTLPPDGNGGNHHEDDCNGSDDNHNGVPCFTPGAQIMTAQGPRRIEELRLGDQVVTRDNGLQAIRWLGARSLGAEALDAPALRPIRIPAGSLGDGLPAIDLLVSPQHRMLLRGPELQLAFSEDEMLIAATHLCGARGIHAIRPDSVTYIHMMFDHHEVVLANGVWSESFQPGCQVMGAMETAQRTEILTLFPALEGALEGGTPEQAYPAARASLKGPEAILARQMM